MNVVALDSCRDYAPPSEAAAVPRQIGQSKIRAAGCAVLSLGHLPQQLSLAVVQESRETANYNQLSPIVQVTFFVLSLSTLRLWPVSHLCREEAILDFFCSMQSLQLNLLPASTWNPGDGGARKRKPMSSLRKKSDQPEMHQQPCSPHPNPFSSQSSSPRLYDLLPVYLFACASN